MLNTPSSSAFSVLLSDLYILFADDVFAWEVSYPLVVLVPCWRLWSQDRQWKLIMTCIARNMTTTRTIIRNNRSSAPHTRSCAPSMENTVRNVHMFQLQEHLYYLTRWLWNPKVRTQSRAISVRMWLRIWS
jgi:hypothetical protein